jgi:hypothetical protein
MRFIHHFFTGGSSIMVHNWWRSWNPGTFRSTTRRRRAPSPRRPPYRPRAEALEDRFLPGFLSPGSFPVDMMPLSIATGDFNGDGKTDLVTANFAANTVSVLLGNGDGTFGSATNLVTAGTGPFSVVTGDFNGDGNADIAVANITTSNVSVFLGNGNGTFQAPATFAVGSGPDGIATGDFNGDGKTDLVTANVNDNTVSILLSNGNGTFQNAVSFAAGTAPRDVAVGDLNGDKNADLVVSDGSGATVSVLLGNGNGAFGAATTFGTENGPGGLALADFNGDGKLDVAVANLGGDSVSILLGNGNGTLQNAINIAGPGGPNPTTVVAADFNGDNQTDLAVANLTANGTVSVLLGNGNGTFQAPANYTSAGDAAWLTTGDFDGNVSPDLAIANGNTNNVTILLNQSPAAVTNLSILAPADVLPGQAFQFTVVARNAGGQTAGNYTGTVHFSSSDPNAILPADYTFTAADNGVHLFSAFLNTVGNQTITTTDTVTASITGKAVIAVTQANFVSSQTQPVGGAAVSVAVGDFRGNGLEDLVTANGAANSISVLLGNGNGTFTPAVNLAVGTNPDSVAVADVNGDGKQDIIVANNGSGTVSLLLGNGNGTFQAPVNFAVGTNPTFVTTGDFNGDGKLDIVSANAGNNTVSVLLGNGNGTFGATNNFGVGTAPQAVAVGDVNADGKADLVVTNQGSNTVSVLLGNGNGTFQNATNLTTGASPDGVTLGDVNGDGKLDILVANKTDNTVSVLLGNGDSTFASKTDLAVGASPTQVVLADFNGDGNLDLAVSNLNAGTVTTLLGNGNGTFGPALTTTSGGNASWLAVGEFDGDGAPDLAVTNSNNDSVTVLTNRNVVGAISFSLSAPATVTAGKPFQVTLTARNAAGQTATNYLGTVHFSSSDVNALLPADFTFTAADSGVHVFTITLHAAGNQTITAQDVTNSALKASATVADVGTGILVTGSGPGQAPMVNVYDAATGVLKFSFMAYSPFFLGGVRVAVGDVNGDGVPDIITSPGPSGGPEVKVFDGFTGAVIRDFMAYTPLFTGGVFVASADFNGDGHADIITGADAGGGPEVRVLSGTNLAVLADFMAYDVNFTGGVRVAAGDIAGNGTPDLITGAGPGTLGPDVRVFDGKTFSLLDDFQAYASAFQGGVFVAAADVNGDGHADVITGAGAGGGPNVKVFDGTTLSNVTPAVLSSYMAYDPNFSGGVQVAGADVDADGEAEVITGPGAGGGPNVRIFNGLTGTLLPNATDSFFAYDPTFTGGVFVGVG